MIRVYAFTATSLRRPLGLTHRAQIKIFHVDVVHTHINDVLLFFFRIDLTLVVWTFHGIDMRQGRVVNGIFVNLIGLLCRIAFFCARHTKIRKH